jgi:NADH-quinone oxidoreductase subunit F
MIGGYTICPLGDAAALPVMSFINKFRDEFEAQVQPRPVMVGSVVTGQQAEGS